MGNLPSEEQAAYMGHYFREWSAKFVAIEVIEDSSMPIRGLEILAKEVATFSERVLHDHPSAKEVVRSIELNFPEFVSGINSLAEKYNVSREDLAKSIDLPAAKGFYNRAMEIRREYLGY